MLPLQTFSVPRSLSLFYAVKFDSGFCHFLSFKVHDPSCKSTLCNFSPPELYLPYSIYSHRLVRSLSCFAVPRKANSGSDSNSDSEPQREPNNPSAGSKAKGRRRETDSSLNQDEDPTDTFPTTIPRKPRRGRRSEAVAVEDFIRNSLERTFASIRQQNSEISGKTEDIMKEKVLDSSISESIDGEDDEEDENDNEDEEEEEEEEEGNIGGNRKKKVVVEEESPNWPVDADVGWGIRASDYFEQHPIKNVVGEDGVEIDWEGEIDDNWVQEINCLEWESFAFHPSPLIVLVFERYNRATENWKNLKELEKAIKVYWNAKDRLPPRAVKIDINIERDLAYALKVRQCPLILFLRGNKILYREKELRTADELVHMIAFFYYNAKKPSWIDEEALTFCY